MVHFYLKEQKRACCEWSAIDPRMVTGGCHLHVPVGRHTLCLELWDLFIRREESQSGWGQVSCGAVVPESRAEPYPCTQAFPLAEGNESELNF